MPAPRILIIDGDTVFRNVLQAYLIERGHVVESLADGREALARWDELRPSLVMVDLAGGDIDGIDLAAAVSRRRDRPAILLCTPLRSAAQWGREVLDALSVDAVITRPAAFSDLAERIEQLILARDPMAELPPVKPLTGARIPAVPAATKRDAG